MPACCILLESFLCVAIGIRYVDSDPRTMTAIDEAIKKLDAIVIALGGAAKLEAAKGTHS